MLVAASAGTGKTAVLVERIIKGLTRSNNPLEIDRLLVVTFTEAAAAEMRERIAKALKERLKQFSGDRHLRRQLTLLYKASISTIHSFCLEIIRMFFYRLDIDPLFRVANEMETSILQQEALEKLFEDYYGCPDSCRFGDLVECYGGHKGDEGLQEIVKELFNYSRSQPWPEKWLRDSISLFQIPEGTSIEKLPFIDAVKDYLSLEIEGAIQILEQAKMLAGKPGGPGGYLSNFENDLMMLYELVDACRRDNWEIVREKWQGLHFSKLNPVKKGEAHPGLQDRVKQFRNKAKDIIGKCSQTFFDRKPKDFINELCTLAPLMEALVELVIDFGKRYRDAKNNRGLMDFSDLEHYCLNLLASSSSNSGKLIPSDIACQLQQRFDEVMVDEYQDVNAVQNAILRFVSRQAGETPNLFAVGDVKQSIYRFRLAEPSLFLKKYKSFLSQKGSRNYRIDLSVNFRCRREVLNGVNFIFRQILTPCVGEIAYDKKAELYYGAFYPPLEKHDLSGKPVEFHVIDAGGEEGEYTEEEDNNKKEENSSENSIEELEALEIESQVVAHRIKNMVEGSSRNPGAEFNIWDCGSKCYRPISYGDIVILMRATKNRVGVFLEALNQRKIPAYAELETGYLDSVEVNVILSLLKVIDNPRQDIPLAAVLRSPLVNLSDSELARVRLFKREEDLYTSVKSAADCKELGVTGEKIRHFLNCFDTWRMVAKRTSLVDLIWQIYRDTGYYSYVGGLPGGRQRQANLGAFYDRAQQFDQFSAPGLFRFLRYIERILENKGDLGAARSFGEKENVVRLMSIHKSKGLEFPVVIVSDLGKNFNLRDTQQELLMHRFYGLGPKFVDIDRRLKYSTLPYIAIKNLMRREALAEELRILYVALTRAREKLVLTGTTRGLEQRCMDWSEVLNHMGWGLPDTYLVRTKNYLDWVGSAIIRHRQSVTLREAGNIKDKPADCTVAKDPSKWDITIWGGRGNTIPSVSDKSEKSLGIWDSVKHLDLFEKGDAEVEEEINRRLNWAYPYENLRKKAAKVTIGEIKRMFEDYEKSEVQGLLNYEYVDFKQPSFLQKKRGLSPVEKGSLIHKILQHIDLEKDLSEVGIKKQIKDMIKKQLLDQEQAKAVDVRPIFDFFCSSLGQRLRSYPHKVRREVPFSLRIPAEEVYPDLSPAIAQDEGVLLQGVIDCFVEEEDGFLLIDFKTNREDSEAIRKPAATYGTQIYYYARALSVIYHRPVKEAYIYFLMARKGVKIPIK